jgi:hypothetical protein
MSLKMSFAAAALCLAAVPALAQSALAQSAAPAPAAGAAPADPAVKARWAACEGDVKSFCASVDRTVKGAMKACLESHAKELSEGCTKARAEAAAEKK